MQGCALLHRQPSPAQPSPAQGPRPSWPLAAGMHLRQPRSDWGHPCVRGRMLLLLSQASPSLTPGVRQETLLPIPAALLSDSLLLGSVTKAVLAPSGNMQSVFVHPLVIGGWCGLVATALNCLPVGCLDGGRIMQARSCLCWGHEWGKISLRHSAGTGWAPAGSALQ